MRYMLVGCFILSISSASIAADTKQTTQIKETNNIVDLTTLQYRVESLQNEHYQLKQTNKSLQADFEQQKTRVKNLEKSLAEAKKLLAQKESKWHAQTQKVQAFSKKLEVEEKRLNMLWNKTHRK